MSASLCSQLLGSQNISARNFYTVNETVGTSFITATGCEFVIPTSNTGTIAMTGAMFYNTNDSKLYIYNGTNSIRTSALSQTTCTKFP